MLDLSAQLQNIAALPADRPMTMPGAFYTSQEQFDREAATVLRRTANQPTNQIYAPEPSRPTSFFTME